MRNKLLWFYQEVNEPEPTVVPEQPKPGPSRTTVSNNSKTPQGNIIQYSNNMLILNNSQELCVYCRQFVSFFFKF